MIDKKWISQIKRQINNCFHANQPVKSAWKMLTNVVLIIQYTLIMITATLFQIAIIALLLKIHLDGN